MREVVKKTSPEQAEKEAEIRKARKQLEDIEGALGRISKLAVTKQEGRGGRELLIFINEEDTKTVMDALRMHAAVIRVLQLGEETT